MWIIFLVQRWGRFPSWTMLDWSHFRCSCSGVQCSCSLWSVPCDRSSCSAYPKVISMPPWVINESIHRLLTPLTKPVQDICSAAAASALQPPLHAPEVWCSIDSQAFVIAPKTSFAHHLLHSAFLIRFAKTRKMVMLQSRAMFSMAHLAANSSRVSMEFPTQMFSTAQLAFTLIQHQELALFQVNLIQFALIRLRLPPKSSCTSQPCLTRHWNHSGREFWASSTCKTFVLHCSLRECTEIKYSDYEIIILMLSWLVKQWSLAFLRRNNGNRLSYADAIESCDLRIKVPKAWR